MTPRQHVARRFRVSYAPWCGCIDERGNDNPLSIAFTVNQNSRMNRGRAVVSHLGVTASALDHSMRQLEERFGVRLLHRCLLDKPGALLAGVQCVVCAGVVPLL